eukprot:CAMPEP_0119054684 /NCGR_PEP_ID=MMETSP1177-20130426/75239_1 /TAXON_ID=2985 /ORGANISM="Ochromonas sp, Strain CCMP1899" /LENGTH=706 /DNA_ID=CAMNT_0007035013 /DNA_START=1284 /DNA_END=3404 /DNA_ORIENTATION=+
MTPRLRVWANKVGVKVSHFREKLIRRRQYEAEDASVVSLSLSSIKSSICEGVDDNTPNTYATPRGYITGFDDSDDNDDEEGEEFEEDIAYGYTDDEHFEEISIRRAASDDKLVQNRIESMKGSDKGHSVYPNNSKQLWEILNPDLDGIPPSDTPFDTALASHGSILNLFLGNSEEDSDVDGDIKEDVMRAQVEGEVIEVLDGDNVEIRSHTEDNSPINSRRNEAMSHKNRCALSQAVGMNLTALDLLSFIQQEEDLDASHELSNIEPIVTTLEEEPGVGGVHTHFTHVVGAMSMRISALGPLILDRCSVYVPIGSDDSSLLKSLQMGLNIISASNCQSSIFPPRSAYHDSSAVLTTSTFADALLVQRWIMNAINLPLLRSIAMDRDIKVPQGDFILSASARGNEVHLALKILTHRDSDDDNEGENEAEDVGGKHRECSPLLAPVLACEWERMGSQCMQRVVLAVLEDLTEVEDDFSLLGIQGGGSGSGDSKERYSSVGFIGVECLLELNALHAIAGNNLSASDLLAAHKLLHSSGSSSLKEIHRVAASVYSTLELDSGVLHTLISSIDINLHIVPHIDKSQESDENDVNFSTASLSSPSVSMSLTMPLAIACTSRLHRGGYAAYGTSPGERVPCSPFPTDISESAAAICYRLLIGDLDAAACNQNIDTYDNHSASRVLAGVLLATHISQLVEFCSTDFFKSLYKRE